MTPPICKLEEMFRVILYSLHTHFQNECASSYNYSIVRIDVCCWYLRFIFIIMYITNNRRSVFSTCVRAASEKKSFIRGIAAYVTVVSLYQYFILTCVRAASEST